MRTIWIFTVLLSSTLICRAGEPVLIPEVGPGGWYRYYDDGRLLRLEKISQAINCDAPVQCVITGGPFITAFSIYEYEGEAYVVVASEGSDFKGVRSARYRISKRVFDSMVKLWTRELKKTRYPKQMPHASCGVLKYHIGSFSYPNHYAGWFESGPYLEDTVVLGAMEKLIGELLSVKISSSATLDEVLEEPEIGKNLEAILRERRLLDAR